MPSDKTILELPITGMTCASCVARNERALRKLDGVDEANVNFATEKATVVFDPAVLTARDLVATVEKSGYGVVTRSETLPILGMTCASCVGRVERALQKTPGVLDAQVNLATEKATVTYVPGQADRAALVAAVQAAGYDVVEAPAVGAAGGAGDEAVAASALDAEQAARAAAYRALRAQGDRRLRPQHDHLRRDHAAALVPLPARLAAQRLRSVGARDAGAVLGGLAVLHRRLGGPAARLQHEHEHAHRHGILGGLPLQRRRRAVPGGVRARRPR